jgi:hypothetical protein
MSVENIGGKSCQISTGQVDFVGVLAKIVLTTTGTWVVSGSIPGLPQTQVLQLGHEFNTLK